MDIWKKTYISMINSGCSREESIEWANLSDIIEAKKYAIDVNDIIKLNSKLCRVSMRIATLTSQNHG